LEAEFLVVLVVAAPAPVAVPDEATPELFDEAPEAVAAPLVAA